MQQLTADCGELLHRSLDVQLNDAEGTWITLWNEHWVDDVMSGYYGQQEGLFMYKQMTGTGYNWVLCVKISQLYYLNVLQQYTDLLSDGKSLELKLRIAFRDSHDHIIMEGTSKELSDVFIVKVTGSEEKTGCEDATLTFKSGTVDRTVSLGEVTAGDYMTQAVNIDRPLSVSWNNFGDCKNEPTYIVLIKDGSVWRHFDAMLSILKKEAEAAGYFITS
jgi:hypothetical protein